MNKSSRVYIIADESKPAPGYYQFLHRWKHASSARSSTREALQVDDMVTEEIFKLKNRLPSKGINI